MITGPELSQRDEAAPLTGDSLIPSTLHEFCHRPHRILEVQAAILPGGNMICPAHGTRRQQITDSVVHLCNPGSDHDKVLDFQRKAHIGGGRDAPYSGFSHMIFLSQPRQAALVRSSLRLSSSGRVSQGCSVPTGRLQRSAPEMSAVTASSASCQPGGLVNDRVLRTA